MTKLQKEVKVKKIHVHPQRFHTRQKFSHTETSFVIAALLSNVEINRLRGTSKGAQKRKITQKCLPNIQLFQR